MKKISFFYSTMIVAVLVACMPQTAMPPTEIPPSATPIPATETPTETPTMIAPTFTGTKISYGVLTLVLPPEVASGAGGSEVPREDSVDAAWWQKAPAHLEVLLGDYFILQGKSRQPRIEVYPAQKYGELVPAVFENMHRLNNILGNPSKQINPEQLPQVPFFNETQVFVSNIQVVLFQNGQGVRFLTEYGQSAIPANNNDLFYQFQGLTTDRMYYVVAIFPITAPGLGESSDPEAAIPIGGVEFPNLGDLNANWDGYYTAVIDLLNATAPDAFTPTLNQLDALVQSMLITP